MDTLTHSWGNDVSVGESRTDLLREINGPAILLLGMYFRESLIQVHKGTCAVASHARLPLPGLPPLILEDSTQA